MNSFVSEWKLPKAMSEFASVMIDDGTVMLAGGWKNTSPQTKGVYMLKACK